MLRIIGGFCILLLACLQAEAYQTPLVHPAAFSIISTYAAPPNPDPTVGVLPTYNDAYANWSVAGLAKIGGIPTRSTQCGSTVTPSGITPPAGGDDVSKINAAITACTAGDVVQLGSGTFQLDVSETVALSKGVTLRGTGSCTNGSSPYCQTVIQYYNGAWPLYNINPQCGATTGTPPGGTAPGTTSTCGSGNPMVLVGPPYPTDFLGWGSGSATNCQIGNADPTTVPCGTTLTADASAGSSTVSVSSTTNFSVGDWVLIDDNPLYTTQTNPLFARYVSGGGPPSTTVSATPDEFSTSGTPITPRITNPDMNCSYSMCTARLNEEIKLISAIGSGTLTFDTPLVMDKRQSASHDARVYWLTGCGCGSGPTPPTRVPFVQQAGIENVTLARASNSQAGPLTFEFCAYCWAKNVETSYWIGGVSTKYSARTEITSSYFHDCVDCQNDGNEYPVAIDSASTEVLLDNDISVRGGKGMVGRVGAADVVAYDYADMTFYEQSDIGNWLLDMDVNGSHEGGTHHYLFEGNWSASCDGDNTHGPASYHTWFRNDCTGFRSNFNDPSNPTLLVSDIINQCYGGALAGGTGVPETCSRLRAIGPMSYNYWYAFVGNVLGLSGQSTTGNGWIYSSRTTGNRGTGSGHTMTDKSELQSGWTGDDPNNCCDYVSDPNLDGFNATQFIFLNGDYDYVNGSIADCAGGSYSCTLPNSFYLASAPSYFGASGTHCVYAWPWVTPAGGSPLQTPTGSGCTATTQGDGLPAKARFDAGTPFVQP